MKLIIRLLVLCFLIPLHAEDNHCAKEREFVELIKNLSPKQLEVLTRYKEYEYKKSSETKWLVGICIVTAITLSSLAFMDWSTKRYGDK